MRTDPVTQNPGKSPHRGHGPSEAPFARRILVALFLLCGGVIATSAAHAGSVMYAVVNYPEFQNGYTVSGTITTTTMNFATEITSWDITITHGTTTIANFNPTVGKNASQAFAVSPISITVPTVGDSVAFENNNNTDLIVWGAQKTVVEYFAFVSPNSLWSSFLSPVTTPVATVVPEPSTAAIAMSGAVTGIAIALGRKRRAQRRHGKAGHTQPTE
jgi:hypothetical protein